MRVEYAFIAEAADAQGGLFYVVRGGTDIWFVPPNAVFPVSIGPMSFVVRLIGSMEEVGKDLPVEFNIVDADGHSMGGTQQAGSIRFTAHPADRTRTGGALLHFRLVGIQVTAPGAYFFQLHSGDERLCQVPFWVLVLDETGEG